MQELTQLLPVAGGMLLLLFLILKCKWPAFIALLITSIVTALMSGMSPEIIMNSVKNGMGSTLEFVAVVIGLGAIFGGLLEYSKASESIASSLLSITGQKYATWALMITGLLVSVPVFFDVGFVLLFPVIAALHQKTGKTLVYFALPLLSGLAVTHAFIPPTPGPLAVSQIIGVPLSTVILTGLIAGIPAAIAGGIIYNKFLSDRLHVVLPDNYQNSSIDDMHLPNPGKVFFVLFFPILLIIIHSLIENSPGIYLSEYSKNIALLLTHPFSALIIANLMAWYFFNTHFKLAGKNFTYISNKALAPAGIIILVTGAGGVFKQILMDTGTGKIIATAMQDAGFSIVVFAFLASMVVRVLQGSATVAMITGAGLVAPLLSEYALNDMQLSTLVIAIASGGTMASHLNDSGFWLVKEFLGVSEREGIQVWTAASSIIGLTGFFMSVLIFHLSG